MDVEKDPDLGVTLELIVTDRTTEHSGSDSPERELTPSDSPERPNAQSESPPAVTFTGIELPPTNPSYEEKASSQYGYLSPCSSQVFLIVAFVVFSPEATCPKSH